MSRTPDLRTTIGFDADACRTVVPDASLIEYINLYLTALGEPILGQPSEFRSLQLGQSLMAHYQAKDALRDELRPPVDRRIEAFINDYVGTSGSGNEIHLPGKTLNLVSHGLARMLSLPGNGDHFKSDIIDSYRLANGVLHNPKEDRRTTQGVFHVAEGGLPVPQDKRAVPQAVFGNMLRAALQPPRSLMQLPFTSLQEPERQAHVWVSLMLRPVICPEVAGVFPQKSMEVRFFAPGNLVSNLDFVESIFGNAGDPYLPGNDAGLDVEHWSGHTGCVILAPHLIRLKKKDVGLPHWDDATERQRRDGMCWQDADELYNNGGAFKLTARDRRGVVVTLIADNYFGYCKKEVKTQIGYAANLYGLCEEEHAGGTLAFNSFDLGEDFELAEYVSEVGHTFAGLVERMGDQIEVQTEGYGIDRKYRDLIYVPEGAHFSLRDQVITWKNEQGDQRLKLLSGRTYMLPYGYRVQMQKPAAGRRWRLVGTVPQATNCHKPCTVSGGGKSEISKSIADAIIHAPFYVQDLKQDFDAVERIIKRDYKDRFRDVALRKARGRHILSPERSLGSVIKLLTPSEEFTDEHNAFVAAIPAGIKELVLLVKRFYKSDWGDNWRDRFTVDIINGKPGHELKYRDMKVVSSYLRVGYDNDGSWRVFSLRKDFSPAEKIQTEDDISASVVVRGDLLPGFETGSGDPVKLVRNCEYRLFQRPDDAIVRGYDKKTEWDMAQPGNFFSNYQPLTRQQAREMIEDSVRFDYFTEPMKQMLRDFAASPEDGPSFVVCSANPRLVNGKPSKNPRYLQTRGNLETPRTLYVAEQGARLHRRLVAGAPVYFPVTAVLTGRRNNPPEGDIRSLAVFNPIHYLPLPEAFMEFTSSMTGKSPSTTGAGSEGALTKGPFNALLPITDLNNALVAFILTGAQPFVTAAGSVGPKFRVDHDISLLVPEIWCRMRTHERSPEYLIEHHYLEKVPAITHNGKELPTWMLGYRITQSFVNHFLARIFSSPEMLFNEDMLKPELQGMDVFADGLDNMLTTHATVAANYFGDGSIDLACPPMRALLHIMAYGDFKGKTLADPEIRVLFTRENMLASEWYAERLARRQKEETALWRRHRNYLKSQPARAVDPLTATVDAS
jgi:phosphoenolpyruvate carboxykinase (diphosphate)